MRARRSRRALSSFWTPRVASGPPALREAVMPTETPGASAPEAAAPRGLVERIVDFSGRRRGLVVLASIALAIFGLWCARATPLDALPDLSDTQVIVATEWMGRNPTLIEDQVTY